MSVLYLAKMPVKVWRCKNGKDLLCLHAKFGGELAETEKFGVFCLCFTLDFRVK